MSTTHLHHIITKHAGGADTADNLIRLSVEDHAEAHRLLYEQHGRWQDKIAWKTLSGQIGNEAARIEAIREGIKTRDMSYFQTDEWSKKISAVHKGVPKSEEHKQSMRKPKTDMHRKKLAEHLSKIEWTDERKNKISATLKIKHKCPHCDFVSNSSHVTRHIGRVHT